MARRTRKPMVSAVIAASMVAALGATCAAKTTITFYHWYNFNPSVVAYLSDAVKTFEKANPGIAVKQMPTSHGMAYVDKALTMAAAGRTPDVIMISGMFLTSMSGILSEVDALADSYGFNKSVSYKSMWRGCSYKGKILGIPVGGGVQRAMFYNTNLMAQRGWDPSKPPTDWPTFLEFCNKLTYDQNGDGKPDVWATDDLVYMQLMMHVAAGGDFTTKGGLAVDWNTPAGVKGLEFADALRRSKAVGSSSNFFTGKNATYMMGPWDIGNVQQKALGKFKWGLARYPTPADTDIRLYASVDALGVGKVPAARRKAAWSFVRFMLSPDMQAKLAIGVGFPPMNRGAFAMPDYKQAVEKLPAIHVASEMMQYGFAPDPSPNDGEITGIGGKWFAKVLTGSLSPREAAAKMQTEATTFLARFQKAK